jgi:hypothetical protein
MSHRCDSLWFMLRLIALGILAIPVCAQTAVNPYDLARFIDSHTNIDWAPIWKAWGVAKPPEMPTCGRGLDRCSADVITVPKPSQAILAVEGWLSDTYLRFVEDGSGWRFAGAYHTSANFHPGRYEVTRIAGERFLRVSGDDAYGTGVDSEIETWFDLSRADFEPVFAFTVQGWDFLEELAINRKIYASASPRSANSIDLELEVVYSGDGVDLGSAEYRATYKRAPDQQQFSLRRVEPYPRELPAISNKDFDELAKIAIGPSNERLLVYTLPRLKEIASGPDSEVKDWLRDVLARCKDTPEKRALQALLGNKR